MWAEVGCTRLCTAEGRHLGLANLCLRSHCHDGAKPDQYLTGQCMLLPTCPWPHLWPALQVHRATLLVDGQPQVVAVKVRHPSCVRSIWQDFQLLRPLAALTGRVRSLRVRPAPCCCCMCVCGAGWARCASWGAFLLAAHQLRRLHSAFRVSASPGRALLLCLFTVGSPWVSSLFFPDCVPLLYSHCVIAPPPTCPPPYPSWRSPST